MASLTCLMLDLKSYYASPAYQLGLLASYASKEPEVRANMEFKFVEFSRDRPAEDVAEAVLKARPDLVCASNYAWNYKKIRRVLDILEASGRDLPPIVLGGPNSPGSFGAGMLERHRSLSALVEGEGEPAFRDICSSLVDSPAKNPFVGSRNCVYRDDSGEVLRRSLGHRIQDLDEVPSPYLTGLLPVTPSPIFYETNRGCPYRCSFCYWGNGNARVYRMSLDRVREEMEFFARNKVSSFWIADANFGIFPSDSEIAEMMSSINADHRYPFKHVGVNWAKNSSDRVLEIAGIFKKGRISCTTTLAIQSVTPEAEQMSNRYSMAPAKFANLMSSAHERNLDTYTDIIWGLPGENVEEYLACLDAVVSTGVPSILIHQLYLLPGTEFFDVRQKLGLTMLSEAGGTDVTPSERSDYWDYIVVSHPKMSREDMRRGTRIMGISHMLHNHDLGKLVNFYLSRYGIAPSRVYDFFDEAIRGRVEGLRPENHEFLAEAGSLILEFADSVGLDEFLFYRRLSEIVWYTRDADGRRRSRHPEVQEFMQLFYRTFCSRFGLCREASEWELLDEMVKYNVLVSPKPGWKPAPAYTFEYDVHAICNDMFEEIHGGSRDASGGGKRSESKASWPEHAAAVRARLAELLTAEHLRGRRNPSTYTVRNPWMIPPSSSTADWLLSSGSKHCIVQCA